MKHEDAVELSRSLMKRGHSHAIQVGVHDNLAPAVQCRVDVYPRTPGFEWTFAELAELNELVLANGLELRQSSLDKKWYVV